MGETNALNKQVQSLTNKLADSEWTMKHVWGPCMLEMHDQIEESELYIKQLKAEVEGLRSLVRYAHEEGYTDGWEAADNCRSGASYDSLKICWASSDARTKIERPQKGDG